VAIVLNPSRLRRRGAPRNDNHIAPGHDSWVIGDEPYVSLHFLGADHYADHS
jgi:hypothetical protein